MPTAQFGVFLVPVHGGGGPSFSAASRAPASSHWSIHTGDGVGVGPDVGVGVGQDVGEGATPGVGPDVGVGGSGRAVLQLVGQGSMRGS